MLKNYFKVALRGFAKQKGYAFLNILGLSIGLASVILIFIYIQDELSYNTMHPAPYQTYGIGDEYTNEQGEKSKFAAAPSGWGPMLKEQMPEVLEVFRYLSMGYPFSMRNPETDNVLLTQDGEAFLVESSYPEVMHFPLVQGNREAVLANPNSIVLSETAARRLFGSTDVVGRQLDMKHVFITDEYINLEVTGVMKDYPGNSHMRPDFLLSLEIFDDYLRENAGVSLAEFLSGMDRFYISSYVRIADGADIRKVEAGLEQIIQDHLADQASQHDPFFTSMANFHFAEDVDWSNWNRAADFDYVIVLASIGFMILLIACINYMNLATAKSAKRSKEVGIRKSLGSSRGKLMVQFFQESLVTAFLALMIALVLTILVLPMFNELTDKQFAFASLWQANILVGLLIIWLGVALVAGSYPAVFLSGFKPVEVLKGKLIIGKGPAYFRKTLVVVQFVVSVLLIISTGVILQQMNMLRSSKLYEQAEQIVSVRFGGGIAPIERYQTLKNEVQEDPKMREVTLAAHLPRRESFARLDASFMFPEISGDQVYDWKQLHGDYDFPEVFDLEFVAGRSFDPQNPADSNNYLLNEAAVRNLNKAPNEIIGFTLLDTATNQSGRVVGVVKDFPYESIHSSIKPLAIQGQPHPTNQILYVKLPVEQLSEKLATLEAKWKEVLPGVGFDYWFLSEEFGRMYYTEIKMANLVQFFSILAVFIACLGLYGLASYTAEQKTKEIGIRKVLGGTVSQILVMLVSSFLKMIFIACLLALPLGYWLMQDWLQNFTYRVDINWIIFVLSVAIIVGITIITVAYESMKASMINPTKALRYE
ncbi:MAG: ABC transporter permease [Bacteroidota bacterium]